MTNAPLISVVMPVYNVERYLGDAVESVLNQTFSDFEFIIIEDPSTDRTSEILDEYAERDKRIRLIRNSNPLGLVRSLNKGFNLASGTYIARQDADDISLLERFEFQVRFLREHCEVGVVGTWFAYIDEKGREKGIWKAPSSPVLVRWSLLFGNYIAHPTVLMHRAVLEGGEVYRPDMLYAEDYDLWVRQSEKTQLANIPKVLYLRRVHERMISVRFYEQQQQTRRMVMRQNIVKLLEKKVPKTLVTSLWRVTCHKSLEAKEELLQVANLIRILHQVYVDKNKLNKTERIQVAEDAAGRLLQPTIQYITHWTISSICVMLHAIYLNWRVVTSSEIKNLIRSLMRRIMRIWAHPKLFFFFPIRTR